MCIRDSYIIKICLNFNYVRFVNYNSQEEVDKAISLYNDYEFNGSKLRVMSGNNFSNGSSSATTASNFMSSGMR